jgi:hypothetical protein
MKHEDTQPRPGGDFRTALFAGVLVACVAAPWVLQFTVAWWAAFSSWMVLAYLYHRLFITGRNVRRVAVAGQRVRAVMAFDLALASFIVLLLWNAIALLGIILQGILSVAD